MDGMDGVQEVKSTCMDGSCLLLYYNVNTHQHIQRYVVRTLVLFILYFTLQCLELSI